MCSHTSSSPGGGCGGGGGGDDGGGGDNDCSSVSLKNPKRQRVPKRGPGVAELEKILREQEKKDDVERVLISPYFFASSSSSSSPSSSFLRNSLPENGPFPVDLPRYTPMRGTLYGNCVRPTYGCGNLTKCGGNNIVGSALDHHHVQDKNLLSAKFVSSHNNVGEQEGSKMASGFSMFSNKSNQNEIFTSSPPLLHPHGFHIKPSQYPPQMANMFPNSTLPSPSSSTTSSGFFHHVEPPSSQRSCRNNHPAWTDEEKIISGKRARAIPSVTDRNPVPLFQFQASSSSSVHKTKFNVGQTSKRDPARSFDLNSENDTKDYGGSCGKAYIFANPKPRDEDRDPTGLFKSTTTFTTSPSFQPGFSRFSSFPFQYDKQKGIVADSNEKISATPKPDIARKKPFFRFIQGEDMTNEAETTLSLSNDRSEGKVDAIDLNLKL